MVPDLSHFPIQQPANGQGSYQPVEWSAEQIDQFAINDPTIVSRKASGHIHWTVLAYAVRLANGNMLESVPIGVEADDVEDALFRARTLYPQGRHFRISNINEACTLTEGLRKDG